MINLLEMINYIEGERVVSKIGGSGWIGSTAPNGTPVEFITDTTDVVAGDLLTMVKRGVDCARFDSNYVYVSPQMQPFHIKGTWPETNLYFYHPDHLGSSSFITDATGYAVQHLQYLPFGETFVDQQNGYDARYTFSAKEKDDETQYSYFGARYYDSDLSVWLSVDPLSDKYPNLSPFAYCANNPVKLVDTDGKEIYLVDQSGNKTKLTPENYKSNIFGSNLTILMSTSEGKKLIEKYMSNDSKDIYMTVGDAGGDASGRTISGFTYENSTKDGKFIYDSEYLSAFGEGFEAFGNLDMSESKGKDIFLISISPDQIRSGPDKSGTFFEFDIQGAETVFHEIKAHVDLNMGDGKKEHEKYGATFSIFNYSKIDPNSPAGSFIKSVLDSDMKLFEPLEKKLEDLISQ